MFISIIHVIRIHQISVLGKDASPQSIFFLSDKMDFLVLKKIWKRLSWIMLWVLGH